VCREFHSSLPWTLVAFGGSKEVTPMTENPLRPECGSDLLRSPLYPHGRDSGAAVRKARMCQWDDLYFGQASDGSWSISVTPLNINHASVSQRRA
jgi:hypothetical protein